VPLRPAMEERRDDGHRQPTEDEEQEQERERIDRRLRGSLRSPRLVRPGDGLIDRVEPGADAVGEMSLAEAWRHDIPQDRRGDRVRHVRLETIADLETHLPVVDEDQEDDAVVEALLPDAPGLRQPDGEVLEALALERLEDGHHDLVRGAALTV